MGRNAVPYQNLLSPQGQQSLTTGLYLSGSIRFFQYTVS